MDTLGPSPLAKNGVAQITVLEKPPETTEPEVIVDRDLDRARASVVVVGSAQIDHQVGWFGQPCLQVTFPGSVLPSRVRIPVDPEPRPSVVPVGVVPIGRRILVPAIRTLSGIEGIRTTGVVGDGCDLRSILVGQSVQLTAGGSTAVSGGAGEVLENHHPFGGDGRGRPEAGDHEGC